jgi:hypothetical protein
MEQKKVSANQERSDRSKGLPLKTRIRGKKTKEILSHSAPFYAPLPADHHPALRNEATALRHRQEFQRSQLTELASTNFESWAKESFEIATKIAYRNGGRIGIGRSILVQRFLKSRQLCSIND